MIRQTVLAIVIASVLCVTHLVSVAQPPPSPPGEPTFQEKMDRVAEVMADLIGRYHGMAEWRLKQALQTDLSLEIQGQPAVACTLIYDIQGRRVRMNFNDGAVLVFDGDKFWATSNSSSPASNAQFHLTTWPWLLAAPFRLREPGVQPAGYRVLSLKGVAFDSIKLILAKKEGEAVEQTRMVYVHPRSHHVHALAGFSLEPNAPDDTPPTHCVIYENNEKVDGVTLATKWTFWNWANDVRGESIGQAVLTNTRFTAPEAGAFDKPAGAHEVGPAANAKQSDGAGTP